jgi:hypothetical protein
MRFSCLQRMRMMIVRKVKRVDSRTGDVPRLVLSRNSWRA